MNMNQCNRGFPHSCPLPSPVVLPDNMCPPGGSCMTTRCTGSGEDFGTNPYVTNIEQAAMKNPFFRRAIWTGVNLQLTLMCIPREGEIGLELHPDVDQFLRIEAGRGRVLMGTTSTSLSYQRDVKAGDAIFIPAGTWHNLINTGTEPLKLYSIYAPVQHPAGTIHCTQADSDSAE